MTAARRSHEDESSHPSQIGAPGRSAGGADRADPVFQPNNGDVTQTIQAPERPGRFSITSGQGIGDARERGAHSGVGLGSGHGCNGGDARRQLRLVHFCFLRSAIGPRRVASNSVHVERTATGGTVAGTRAYTRLGRVVWQASDSRTFQKYPFGAFQSLAAQRLSLLAVETEAEPVVVDHHHDVRHHTRTVIRGEELATLDDQVAVRAPFDDPLQAGKQRIERHARDIRRYRASLSRVRLQGCGQGPRAVNRSGRRRPRTAVPRPRRLR